MSDLFDPAALLGQGVASLLPQLQPDGTLHDPVFACPTQYGTAYLAWCCTVLAGLPATQADARHRERAAAMLRSAMAHTADPDAEPYASGFDRATLGVTGHLNHRDFTWPPLLKTYLGLADLGVELDPAIATQLAAVRVDASFRSRPPSNWAAVWVSGEWLRMRAGLSPDEPERLDGWLDAFFAGGEVGLHLELGLYAERGLPNAYDLFTRVHLLDLLQQGYHGRHRSDLEAFLATGLRRSLDLQLSDGSVASGYRSTGQTWVLGAQIALFTGHRALGLAPADDLDAAQRAAWRAYRALSRYERPGGVFSPVQNVLPPEVRVGYERYTADGHYSPLALAFLASAVVAGFGAEPAPSVADLDDRPPAVRVEADPTWRGVAHAGRVSVGVHTRPDDAYDALGLVDISLGSDRWLQFVSTVQHLAGGPRLVPGLAVRSGLGGAAVDPVGARTHRVTEPLHVFGSAGLAFATVIDPAEAQDGPDVLAGQAYRFRVSIADDGIEVEESTPGLSVHRTLLLPYLADAGTGSTTVVEPTTRGVRLRLGTETVELSVADSLERVVVVPTGYESRRGWCGLIRLDLAEPADLLRWRLTSSG